MITVDMQELFDCFQSDKTRIGKSFYDDKNKQLTLELLDFDKNLFDIKFQEVYMLTDPNKNSFENWKIEKFETTNFSDNKIIVEATLINKEELCKIGFVASRWKYSLKK